MFGCCVLLVLFVGFRRHLAFLFTYSPISGNSQSKTKRFYDRLSFERARHGLKKKKRLLQSQLVARGPGWYSPAELKERLFTNKSKRLGDDLKEALRTDDDTLAWQAWHVAHDLIWQCCRPGPPLVFPGEKELIRAMYDQIGKEEQVISPPYTRTPLDASMRGRKKRKQGEDNALVG